MIPDFHLKIVALLGQLLSVKRVAAGGVGKSFVFRSMVPLFALPFQNVRAGHPKNNPERQARICSTLELMIVVNSSGS